MLGNLVSLPGREINAETIRDADALLVRSVTTVNSELLKDSSISFVGTATSGIDHVDLDYLRQNRIHFAYAPGCNAQAVVQYVFAVLAWLSEHDGFDWQSKTVGIIGGGKIGTLLATYLQSLGMGFVIHDPFLDESYEFADKLVSLDVSLNQDVISLHCSLRKNDPHSSFHLLDANVLNQLSEDSILINASRGSVIDNQALKDFLTERQDVSCVLDVWENEPAIDASLLQEVRLGTSHIAGYSLEGKEQGSAQIYQAMLDCFAINDAPAFPVNHRQSKLEIPLVDGVMHAVNRCILSSYNINGDDDLLRQATKDNSQLAVNFDGLRKNYSLRREFSHFKLMPGLSNEAYSILKKLGFA